MIRGYAFILVLAVLAAAFCMAWFSTTRTIYFPPSLMTQPSGCVWARGMEPMIDDFEADWFGGELRRLEEPSLYLASLEEGAANRRIIRFTWIRSFHEPTAVRIDVLTDGSATLTAKQRASGFQGANRTLQRALSEHERVQLGDILADTAVLEQAPKACVLGMDGANWIIENAGGPEGYRYVNRWSPEDGPVRTFGLFMLDLTGWTIEDIY
jgi:hypothetical protein